MMKKIQIPTEEEMLVIARLVLNGEMKLQDVVKLERPVKVYVGVMLVIASGFRLREDGSIEGGLGKAIAMLTQGHRVNKEAEDYGDDLLVMAKRMRLCVRVTPHLQRGLVVRPTDAMLELIRSCDKEHLDAYMAVIHEEENQKAHERKADEALLRKLETELAAKDLAARFLERHGEAGREALRVALDIPPSS